MTMHKNGLPRIICVGSNIESLVALTKLLSCNVNIVGLVTLPPGKYKRVSDYVDLHPFCEKNRIVTIDTLDINDAATLKKIRKLTPDYIFTLGWSQLFKKELLAIPSQYIVGSHPSPLPEGRGRAPVPWTILERKKYTAVTLFRMTEGVDDGPILIQKWFRVPQGIYAKELYDLVAMNLAEAFCELYRQIISGQVVPIAQDMSAVSYRAKRTPRDGHINFSRSAEEIETLVRAVSFPYPGAYTYYKDLIIRVWRVSLDGIPKYTGLPGQILLRTKDRILVHAGDAPIWFEDWSADDGSEIPLKFFRTGDKFGYAVEDELFQLRMKIKQLEQMCTQLAKDS